MVEGNSDHHKQAFTAPKTPFIQSFDLATGKCNLAGVDRRRNPCPNDRRKPEHHMQKVCDMCISHPDIAR
jgi:hypothetical protein